VDGVFSFASFLLIGVGLLATLLTWLMRRHALSSRFLDWPNARSSHSVPTPRGGGVAIVAVFLVGVLVSGLVFDAAIPWYSIQVMQRATSDLRHGNSVRNKAGIMSEIAHYIE